MPLWKMILSYNGTGLHGWQVQPGRPTVQGHLADALFRITGERTLPQGSGRTDAGVHALGQVASVVLASPIPASNLLHALNRVLPAAIRVLSITAAEPLFHARHSACSKTYEYRLFLRHPLFSLSASSAKTLDPLSPDRHDGPERICSPLLAPFVWDFPQPLDLDRLTQASTHLLGHHDFTSFAASARPSHSAPVHVPAELLPDYPATPPTPCRTISAAGWHLIPDTASPHAPLLCFRITGSGFLHHMVRNLVGTLTQAGLGRLPAASIATILAARDRSAAGPTAPAQGLFLVEVHYA